MTYISFGTFVYRGEYEPVHPTGEPTTYYTNDMVLFEGKIFVANSTIAGETPDTSSDWIPFGNSRVSFRDISPPNPQVGDTWINSATGKYYTFVDDESTTQWVEL